MPRLPAVQRYHIGFLSLQSQWCANKVLRVSQQVGFSASSATAAAAPVHDAPAAAETALHLL